MSGAPTTPAESAKPVPAIAGATRGYIATPAYDLAFLILAPLLSLVVAVLIADWVFPFEVTHFLGGQAKRIVFFGAIWTYAHLFAVVFRSHLDRAIFRRHRLRFTVVPVVVFLAAFRSDWVLISGVFLAAMWDVYHTSMQNFGLCRIYDAKAGNPPQAGRTLDLWVNHCVYIGPILGGLNLLPTVVGLLSFGRLGWDVPKRVYQWIGGNTPEISLAVVTLGTCYLVYYVVAFLRLVKRGHRVSWQKVTLLVSTAATSIYAWGFLPHLEAFFVSNLFHGLQYFAIVWWFEKKNLLHLIRVPAAWGGMLLVFGMFTASLIAAGMVYEYSAHASIRWLSASMLVVSMMHFWWDSFIWSVRRQEV